MQNMLDILLVEDNAADIEMTLDALKENNLANRVRVLKDGEAASQCIFREGDYRDDDICSHPSLILLDIHLPKVDGLTILRRIRSDERTKAIPVVVLTSSRSDRDRIESYQLGVNSYIEKPIEFADFAKVVAQIGFYWAVLNKPPHPPQKA